MATLFDPAARAALRARAVRLTPDAAGRWGRLTAHEMVCHVSDQLRVALGDVPTAQKPMFLTNRLLRELFVFVLPWPKGKMPTAPEMQSSRPGDWARDVETLGALLDRFGTRQPDGTWAPHPAFGRLSGREWGRLCHKHTDYHFQQFGV
jgi:hypothetical protein